MIVIPVSLSLSLAVPFGMRFQRHCEAQLTEESVGHENSFDFVSFPFHQSVTKDIVTLDVFSFVECSGSSSSNPSCPHAGSAGTSLPGNSL